MKQHFAIVSHLATMHGLPQVRTAHAFKWAASSMRARGMVSLGWPPLPPWPLKSQPQDIS
jgi:hypothetical protein